MSENVVAAEKQPGEATALTLEEYAERGASDGGATNGLAPEVRRPRWLVGILGGSEHRGRWRLASRLRIAAIFGGAKLDLGNAEPEAPESVITIFAFFGGVEIVAPPGVSIQLSGISLLGGKSDERAEAPPLPGAPLIRVRVLAILGGVKVKDRNPSRKSATAA